MHSDIGTVPERLRSGRELLHERQRAVAHLMAMLPQVAANRITQVSERGRRITADTRAELDDITARRDALLSSARDQVLAAAAELAPGPLSVDWDDAAEERVELTALPVSSPAMPSGQLAGSAEGPVFVRVGRLPGHRDLPAVLPLLGAAGWTVRADTSTFGWLAAQVACRVLGFAGTDVRVCWAAPEAPEWVGALASPDGRGRGPVAVVPGAAGLLHALERLAAGVDRVLTDPEVQTCGSLLGAARVRGRSPHPFLVLVLDAAWLDTDAWVLLDGLLERGAAGGLTVLLRTDPAAATPGPGQATTAHLSALGGSALLPLEVEAAGGRTVGEWPVAWTADPLPPPAALAAAAAALRRDEPGRVGDLRTYGLAELVEELTDRWLDRGERGVRALLGRGRAPLYLELRAGAPRLPHAVVAGAPGQGVTNALQVVVHTLAAQYAPGDLEVVLLAAGDDDTFDALGPNDHDPTWLPQVVSLGTRLTPADAAAALELELGELARRAELSDCFDAQTSAGGPGDSTAPVRSGDQQSPGRRVIVVDDLQRLTEAPDAARLVRQLEVLARRGPDLGVHLVLGTHDTTGLLRVPGGAALLAMLPSRVALSSSQAQLDALLGAAVPDALRRPGDVVLTTRPGQSAALRSGVLPWVDPAASSRLRRDLWLAAPPGSPPTAPRPGFIVTPVSTEQVIR